MFAMAPTDQDWFEQLRSGSFGDLVNFWTPNPWNIKRLSAGDRFYFMLKAPIRLVGGYGHFVNYKNMSTSQAWGQFGLGNGVYSLGELVERTQKYAEKNVQNDDPVIGCIFLSDPVWFDDEDFFSPSDYGFDFSTQIVKVKYFEDSIEIPYIPASVSTIPEFEIVPSSPGKKRRVPVRDRVGQPAFRAKVLSAYGKRCAVTGIRVAEVLEAAHIQPYVNEQSNHVQNGICLRVDIHRLFDEGLFSITDDFKISVSKRLLEGPYAKIDGRILRLPKSPENDQRCRLCGITAANYS